MSWELREGMKLQSQRGIWLPQHHLIAKLSLRNCKDKFCNGTYDTRMYAAEHTFLCVWESDLISLATLLRDSSSSAHSVNSVPHFKLLQNSGAGQDENGTASGEGTSGPETQIKIHLPHGKQTLGNTTGWGEPSCAIPAPTASLQMLQDQGWQKRCFVATYRAQLKNNPMGSMRCPNLFWF